MRNKLILTICLTALLPVAGVWTAQALAEEQARMTISDNGNALMKVVIAAEHTLPEKTAAEELTVYLKKITGADFQFKKSPNSKTILQPYMLDKRRMPGGMALALPGLAMRSG